MKLHSFMLAAHLSFCLIDLFTDWLNICVYILTGENMAIRKMDNLLSSNPHSVQPSLASLCTYVRTRVRTDGRTDGRCYFVTAPIVCSSSPICYNTFIKPFILMALSTLPSDTGSSPQANIVRRYCHSYNPQRHYGNV